MTLETLHLSRGATNTIAFRWLEDGDPVPLASLTALLEVAASGHDFSAPLLTLTTTPTANGRLTLGPAAGDYGIRLEAAATVGATWAMAHHRLFIFWPVTHATHPLGRVHLLQAGQVYLEG